MTETEFPYGRIYPVLEFVRGAAVEIADAANTTPDVTVEICARLIGAGLDCGEFAPNTTQLYSIEEELCELSRFFPEAAGVVGRAIDRLRGWSSELEKTEAPPAMPPGELDRIADRILRLEELRRVFIRRLAPCVQDSSWDGGVTRKALDAVNSEIVDLTKMLVPPEPPVEPAEYAVWEAGMAYIDPADPSTHLSDFARFDSKHFAENGLSEREDF